MNSHNELTDSEFLNQFENCRLKPALFNHEAHIRLAWILIKQIGVDEACTRVCEGIKKYDLTVGDGTKFHKTLTVASVKIVNYFNNRGNYTRFEDLISDHPQLVNNFKNLLSQHYDLSVLTDENAKNTYVEPIEPFV